MSLGGDAVRLLEEVMSMEGERLLFQVFSWTLKGLLVCVRNRLRKDSLDLADNIVCDWSLLCWIAHRVSEGLLEEVRTSVVSIILTQYPSNLAQQRRGYKLRRKRLTTRWNSVHLRMEWEHDDVALLS